MPATLDYHAQAERRRQFFEVPANVRMYSERRIVDFVMERIRQAREGKVFQELQKNYSDYRRAYEGKFKHGQDIPKWRNRLYVKLSFKVVETLRAYFDDAFFGKEPYAIINPRYHLWKDAARNMESLLQYHATRMRKRRKMQSVFNSVLKYGIGVTRSYWNFERGVKPVRQFQRDENGFLQHFEMTERQYVKKDSPDFIWVDPMRVAFDPLNWEIEDMRYVVEELDMDFDRLYNSRDRYDWMNLEEIERDLRGGYPASGHLTAFGKDPYSESDYVGTLSEGQQRSYDYTRKRVSLLRYEGKLDMPGNQEDPRIYEIYIANNNHLAMLKRCPYSFDKISYNKYGIIPREDSAVGIGAIEPILTDQRILNILVNVRLDSLHLLLSPRMLRHKNAVERGTNNIANVAPGGFIDVKSASDIGRVITPLQMPDQAFSTWHQFWQMQNQHAEETLAMNPNARGMLAQEKRSATEVVRALESANARFLHMVNFFADSGYVDQVEKECAMVQQLMEQDTQVLVTGDPQAGEMYKNLAPWDIQGDFMFQRHDPTKANKEMEAQLWAQLLQAFAPYWQILQQQNPQITPIPFLRGILEASPVFNKLKIDNVLPDVSPEAKQFLGSENPALDKMLGGSEVAGGGTPPGGGAPAGTPPLPVPQPEATAMGIAAGR